METFDPMVELIQLKILINLENVINSEITSFSEDENKDKSFQNHFKKMYDIALTNGKKCSYNPIVKLQVDLVEQAFEKYQQSYK